MELTILGSGSATPRLDRVPTAHLIEENNHYYLIDCGEGTQFQFLKYKLKLSKIKAIFISHMHGDHFLGLPGLLSTMHLMGRNQPIHLFGPKGLKEIIDLHFNLGNTWLSYEIIFQETEQNHLNHIFSDEQFDVYSFPLNHRIICTGYKLVQKTKPRKLINELISVYNFTHDELKELKKGNNIKRNDGTIVLNDSVTTAPKPPISYAFCSDTAPFEELKNYLKGTDWLYHEATFLNDLKNKAILTFHSTTFDAASTAKEASVKNLIIGHYSSRYESVLPFKDEAEQIFKPVYLAYDGLKFDLEIHEDFDKRI